MPTLAVDLGTPADAVVHVIRLALTPVFLLLSIAALLNVFASRLTLVADRVEQVNRAFETADAAHAQLLRRQLIHLRRRTLALDTAVILAAAAKAAICTAVLLLFAGARWGHPVGGLLILAFGLAILCALGAILAFAAEMLMAGTGIRADAAHGHSRHRLRRAAPDSQT